MEASDNENVLDEQMRRADQRMELDAIKANLSVCTDKLEKKITLSLQSDESIQRENREQ
jgi:hypothetical protein